MRQMSVVCLFFVVLITGPSMCDVCTVFPAITSRVHMDGSPPPPATNTIVVPAGVSQLDAASSEGGDEDPTDERPKDPTRISNLRRRLQRIQLTKQKLLEV